MYEIHPATYWTPRSVPVTVYIRDGTNDHNTANSSLTEDEYGLRDRRLSGLALDIGGYLGTVALALAVDNPDLRVICLEPVPENIELIWRNLARNGVDGRVDVVEGLAGSFGQGTIRYRFQGNATALHHAFVGNSTLAAPEAPHTALCVPSYDLTSLLRATGRDSVELISLMKIDCEGGEYAFLGSSAALLGQVDAIVGEWHPNPPEGGTKTRADIVALLAATHDVSFSGPEAGPGGFVAERRH